MWILNSHIHLLVHMQYLEIYLQILLHGKWASWKLLALISTSLDLFDWDKYHTRVASLLRCLRHEKGSYSSVSQSFSALQVWIVCFKMKIRLQEFRKTKDWSQFHTQPPFVLFFFCFRWEQMVEVETAYHWKWKRVRIRKIRIVLCSFFSPALFYHQ